MPVITRRRILAAATALALAAAAACSSSAGSGGSPTSSQASTTPSTSGSSTKALGLEGPKKHKHRHHHRMHSPKSSSPTQSSSAEDHPKHRHHHHATPTPTPTHTRKHKHKQAPVHVPASGSVYAIGDSVMIDAQPDLYNDIPNIKVDADVSRQASSGVYVVQQQRASGTLADTTIFGLGTNGTFSSSELSELISLTAGHHLIVITSHCPYCSWTDSNNAMVHQLCTPANHCTIADFQSQAEQNPEWFGGDGVHMAIGGTGAAAYAQIVANAYASLR
jgi:hypothetical protein